MLLGVHAARLPEERAQPPAPSGAIMATSPHPGSNAPWARWGKEPDRVGGASALVVIAAWSRASAPA